MEAPLVSSRNGGVFWKRMFAFVLFDGGICCSASVHLPGGCGDGVVSYHMTVVDAFMFALFWHSNIKWWVIGHIFNQRNSNFRVFLAFLLLFITVLFVLPEAQSATTVAGCGHLSGANSSCVVQK